MRARGGISYGSAADVASTDSDYNVLDRVTPDDGATVLTLAQWQAQGHELHSFSATPASLWVNDAAADYHLKAGSPAIDKGPALANATSDIDLNLRPWGVELRSRRRRGRRRQLRHDALRDRPLEPHRPCTWPRTGASSSRQQGGQLRVVQERHACSPRPSSR